MNVAAIDPGVHHFAISIWSESQLVNAGLVQGDKKLSGPPAWAELRSLLVPLLVQFSVEKLWIEVPQVYQQRYQKGDQNDLIQLALCIGALSTSRAGENVYTCFPREWKGQVPKKVTMARCLKKLSSEEQLAIRLPKDKKKQTDVWDAVGIGLWALKR